MSAGRQGKKSVVFFRLAGVCGILGSVLPLVMIVSATFLSSWFRWDTNALSEMGVREEAWLFNSAVVVGGVLNFLFAMGLRGYLSGERLTRAGVASIMLSSVFLALVGIFTLDYLVAHAIMAFGYFVLAPAGFLLVGLGTDKDGIRKLSIACGIAALLAILVLPIGISVLSLKVGFAVPELTEGLIISVWTTFISAKLIESGAD
jgi:hypothetical membrane protein